MSRRVRDTAPVRTVSGSCLLSRNVGKWVVSAFSLGREPASVSTSARTRACHGETQEARIDRTEDKPQLPPDSPRQGYFEKRSNGMHKVKCYNCDLIGHFVRDCRKPRRASSSNTRLHNQGTTAGKGASLVEGSSRGRRGGQGHDPPGIDGR